MSKLRYLLVTAALYGPFVYAADPVTVNQSDRKTMYGTAAVRPTPDAFDLASRGMCYVATDTGTVTEWTGTAWITTATCPGSATTSTNNSAGQYADDADFTDGTSVGVLSQCVAEGTASPVTDGDVGACSMTTSRAVRTTLATTLSGEDQTNSVFKVEQQWDYENVAASQTDQAMGATGGAGDLVANYYCVATGTTGGVVEIEDGAGSAFTLIPSGATAGVYQSNYLGWVSTNGAWEVTTPTNITCRFAGRFQ